MVNNLDTDPARETVEAFKKIWVKAVARFGNVIAPDFADRFVRTVLLAFKGIDIIVNNAGKTRDPED
ncbi:3-oxoacyl-[acyl-carrier protein] reductase [Paraburkholderia caribensis MBA4]|uniref:3-oxoacyl-[acyl-carrier protein] reductase n=1 Tax=Paraburkholderia caribensis MBA4 TaxID=1323664 RepID=A0A0P0R4R5_9BURK|nr:3-oxoacyl-[acyl-carrier protein] reductase [Paraburkholderia caribensis MBA4]